jgi:hypothetical protein
VEKNLIHNFKRYLAPFLCFYFTATYAIQAKTCSEINPKNIWIWPKKHEHLNEVTDKKIFLLQFNYQKKNHRFISLGPAPHPINNNKLVIVFRLETLPPIDLLVSTFKKRRSEWEKNKVHVTGLQLDFDSPTRKLNHYQRYLINLKLGLTSRDEDEISITGLLDWHGRNLKFENDLSKLHIPIFWQLYRGQHSLSENELAILDKIPWQNPFLFGLLPNQELPFNMIELQKNHNFQGIICFYGQ